MCKLLVDRIINELNQKLLSFSTVKLDAFTLLVPMTVAAAQMMYTYSLRLPDASGYILMLFLASGVQSEGQHTSYWVQSTAAPDHDSDME